MNSLNERVQVLGEVLRDGSSAVTELVSVQCPIELGERPHTPVKDPKVGHLSR